MSDIPPVQCSGVAVLAPPGRHSVQGEATSAAVEFSPVDHVEISEVGAALSLIDAPRDIRIDKVESIREAIRNGTYETPEKINLVVDRLMDVFGLR